MQFARAVADCIIFLEGGEIKEEATPEEFSHRQRQNEQRNS